MNFHAHLPRASALDGCVLTIGTFDGVHRGHQALVEAVRREAMGHGLPSAVLTFTDMPHCYFRPDDCPRLLTLPEEKAQAFEKLEIDHLWLVPFNGELARRSAEEFTAELVECLGLKLLVIGPDFALGRGRTGDAVALRVLGEKLGFGLQVLDGKVEEAGAPISSTRVRQEVESGNVALAARLLGRPFSLAGEVVSGKQLGRTIGVPTINLRIHARKVVPVYGIYAARAFFDEETQPHFAALSIGTNPTVGGETLAVEFHVINEDIPVPPRCVRLELVEYLRGEENFPSVEALVVQMQRDIARAAEVLNLPATQTS